MAVPFRRTSKTKKRMRRTHLKKTARSVIKCPNCGAPIQPHRACVSCGFYKGKDVLGIQEKEEVNTKTETKKEEVKEVKKTPAKKTTTKKTTSKKETKEK